MTARPLRGILARFTTFTELSAFVEPAAHRWPGARRAEAASGLGDGQPEGVVEPREPLERVPQPGDRQHPCHHALHAADQQPGAPGLASLHDPDEFVHPYRVTERD